MLRLGVVQLPKVHRCGTAGQKRAERTSVSVCAEINSSESIRKDFVSPSNREQGERVDGVEVVGSRGAGPTDRYNPFL